MRSYHCLTPPCSARTMSKFSGAPWTPTFQTISLSPNLCWNISIRCAPRRIPSLIEDATGCAVSVEELRERTFTLAQSLRAKYNIGEKQVVLLFIPTILTIPLPSGHAVPRGNLQRSEP
ncbi:hypothetical protein B0H16DRAFT_333604 [Mycena metata]|uniref:Uncharacterized protein n=1 Tax=Mycena metata TaxID=1033252 RepID=A0AAD7HMK3_9AGAR|nr:hypothetical protein B0H16DRAFT_333604 [Mycena metata]